LRRFGLNTLAVEVWARKSEALWEDAAVPPSRSCSPGSGPSSSPFASVRTTAGK